MKNEFDELLRRRFDETELAYNPAQWDSMNARLNMVKGGGNKKFWFLFSASAMAASLAFAFGLFYHPSGHKTGSQPVARQAEENRKAGPEQNVAGDNMAPLSRQYQAHKKKKDRNEKTAADEQEIPVMVTEQQPYPVQESPVTAKKHAEQKPEKPERSDPFYYDPMQQAVKDRTGGASLSLAGGVSYGSMNTGFTLGINARTRLGSGIYLEGDLGYVGNTNSNAGHLTTVTASVYKTGNVTSSFDDAATVQQEEVRHVSSLNTLSYVQFTPAVGYEFSPKVSLSIGADVQRLLQYSEQETLVYNDGRDKVIPGMDYGLSAKTEIAVTKRLKAGMQYREGLNNLVRGENGYFDRRYLQVQLKFRVAGK